MKVYSPLRYPGGKRKLIPYLEKILTENQIQMKHYVEPYAGGAAVALHFLLTNQAEYVHINDFNHSIYALWFSLLNQTEEFCDRIQQVSVTLDEWYRQKELQFSNSLFDLGFSTFFLNRTNRSGIIKGGVIGGFDQTGKYKIDARFGKKRLIERIRKIAEQKDRIILTQNDALQFMTTDVSSLPVDKTLIYLDPPYYVKGQKLYDNFYQHEDHAAIAQCLTRSKFHWLLSYDNCPEVVGLYKGNVQMPVSLAYTAQSKIKATELMVFSKGFTPVPQN